MSDERDGTDAAVDAAGATHRQAVAARRSPPTTPTSSRRHGSRRDSRTPARPSKKKAKKAGQRARVATRSPSSSTTSQVVAELRKVIWPNRKQMVTYTTVVLVFLAFMVTLIGLVDLGVAKLVLLVFGSDLDNIERTDK